MAPPKRIIIDFPSVVSALGMQYKESDIHFAMINTLQVCLSDIYLPLSLYQLNDRQINRATLDDVKDTLSYYSFRYNSTDKKMRAVFGTIIDVHVDDIYVSLTEALKVVDPTLSGLYKASQVIGGLYVLTRT